MAHRTALVAAGSIAIVIFAGAVAVGANLGILNVADSRPIGKLSAAADVPASGLKVADASVASPTAAVSQDYVIKNAGTVSVAAGDSGLRLVDVSARPGWKWTLAQTANERLTVTFRSRSLTYKFLAILGRGRTIVARVDQPVTKAPPAASAAVVAWSVRPATRSASPPATAAPHGDESDHGAGGLRGGTLADD
jgi:hypothetical protein